MTLRFRPMADGERDFVVSGWSSSYRMSHFAGPISMTRYASVMHTEIEALISHPMVETIVAERVGETDHMGRPFLYGFIATSKGITRDGRPYVHYVYVKNPYRRGKQKGMAHGYAAMLFEAAGIDARKPFVFGHQTATSIALSRKVPHAEFDPLPMRYLR